MVVSAESCREVGLAAGLAAVGVTTAEPFTDTRAVLEERRAAGLHGAMQFTYRNPARSTEPARVLAGARSLVVGAWAYPVGRPARPVRAVGEPVRPVGEVARYASGDVYGRLREALDAVAAHIEADGYQARVVLDDNALVDRAAAYRAGIGWFGKNSNVLVPGVGSWVVVGSVVTDAALEPAAEPVPDGCGGCTRCIDGCPTGAIVAPGVVDARRCLAWLVQAEGDFPEELRPALGARIYGCDDCQVVCPQSRPGVDGSGVDAGEVWVDLVGLLTASDDELMSRHGRWYIPRRDPRYLRRNALVALGNIGTVGGDTHADRVTVAEVVRRYCTHPDGMLRRHAVWAAGRLGLVEVEVEAGEAVGWR